LCRSLSFSTAIFVGGFVTEVACGNVLPKQMQGTMMIDLKQYGYTQTGTAESDSVSTSETNTGKTVVAGRVTEQYKDHYRIVCPHGEVQAFLKGSFIHGAQVRSDLPCVGDFVMLEYNKNGPSLIGELLPRRTKFSRADFFGHAVAHVKANMEQVVATNFDFVFILTSLNLDFNVNRIARYLTQAWQSGAEPAVLLTKADLAENFEAQIDAVREAAPGVPVFAVSSQTGFGLDALDDYMKPGKTVVFLGMSGVGKSSLLNALMEQKVATVKAIREDDSRGRHTTTHRQLFMLPSGAMVIDTPGMRELGLFDADDGISAGFSDVEELFAQCRFNDCRHKTEPGCAVLAALADGSLNSERWERYLAQTRENKFVNDKAGYFAEKKAFHKSIAQWSKQRKKNGGRE
jgi:ribosome biogenesis GTPase